MRQPPPAERAARFNAPRKSAPHLTFSRPLSLIPESAGVGLCVGGRL
jgi:hypothetical protein